VNVAVHAHSKGLPLPVAPDPDDKIFAAASEYLRDRGIGETYWGIAGLRVANTGDNDLVIPYWEPDGTPRDFLRRRRLFSDEGPKFSQAKGSGLHLYWAQLPKRRNIKAWPEILKDTKCAIYIVEGEVKAMSLAQHGIPTIGIGGAYNWGKDHELLEEWDLIALKGRKIIVVYDADALTKLQVQDALLEFAALLRDRMAEVWILPLEPVNNDPATGVDDYVAVHGIQAFRKFSEKHALPADDPLFEHWGTAGRLKQMNDRHAVVMAGSQAVVLTERKDKILLSRPADLAVMYDNQFVNKKKLYKWWLEHPERRTYEDIVFEPNGTHAENVFNLWRGFAVEPKQGKCNLFLRHIRENIAGGDKKIYNYVVAWMADAVQNPSKRPGTALALRGLPGTGKGIFVTEFGRLYREPHFVRLRSARQLTGRFNAHMMEALIVFADEALWAGDHSAAGPLKALVTEDQLPIELKGKDIFLVKNHVRLILASNEPWVVPASFWERRFCALDVGDKRMQDSDYFGEIVQQMASGGREALLYYLQNFDLSGINLRDFPKTDALWEQKLHSMGEVAKFWHGRLVAGRLLDYHEGWERNAPTRGLHELFAEQSSFKGRAAQSVFGREMRRLVPTLRVRRTLIRATGKQVREYAFPSLEDCRTAFEQLIGQEINWDE